MNDGIADGTTALMVAAMLGNEWAITRWGKIYYTYRLGRPHICHLSSTESFKFLYRKSKFLVDYQVGKMYHTYHLGSRKEKNTYRPDLLGKTEGQFQFNWMTLTSPMLANGLVLYAGAYI